MKFNKLLFGGLLATGATIVAAQDADAAEAYQVESGDTLTKISHKFAGDNSLVEGIAKDNNIKNVDVIYAGETLTINSKAEAAAPAQEQTYTAPAVTYTEPVAAPAEEAPVAETPAVEVAAPVVETSAPAAEAAAPVEEVQTEVQTEVKAPEAPVVETTPAEPAPAVEETKEVAEAPAAEKVAETPAPVVEEPVQAPTPEAPVAQTPEPAPAVEEAAPTQEAAPVQETASTTTTTNAAKEWIAQKESSGSYTATNGKYIGRYQLDSSYLNGDYSPENQEKVAEEYVTGRYGSWEGAQSFWMANGWY